MKMSKDGDGYRVVARYDSVQTVCREKSTV